MANNYTLGRGKVYFARFVTDTQNPNGFAYVGNTPEFNLTIETEDLDHYSSDQGIREKDDSVPLEVNRSGSMITDNIDPENVALFFFGEASVVSQPSVISAPETITGVEPGLSYQLGQTPANPTGYVGIDPTGFAVTIDAAPVAENTDYVMDYDLGMITFTDAITTGDAEITYAVLESTRQRTLSGTTPVEGAMRYVAANPKGKDFDYYMPYVKITPNGDLALKGDEWQQIPYTLEILKPTSGGNAILMDGQPAYA